ncbi:MAG: hypothetical protein LBQ31_09580 [Bacteroidales bacterium]|jgi:hypothetical protein|nr:hypothetical protein [Bacteroidales bacterium]
MLQTISLDEKTLLIKAEHESDLSWIYQHLNEQNKQKNVDDLLLFASKNRVIENDYKFNRDDCYVR